MQFEPLGKDKSFGVRVNGIDVRKLSDKEFKELEYTFYDKGVMAITDQVLTPEEMRDFAARFGKVYRNPTTQYGVKTVPEIMILSNARESDGKVVGQSRAGEPWHTDMSYNMPPGRITMLNGHEVPFRDGVALGNTRFANMYAVYEALSADIKKELDGKMGKHDFYYAYNRTIKYENKKPLTDEQKAMRPPVLHPIVGKHPVTGRKVLYVNYTFTNEIVGLEPKRSQELLDYLFEFSTRPEFLYSHSWRTGDLVFWDDLSTLHKATLDYDDNEIRYMLRAQVEGDKPLALAS